MQPVPGSRPGRGHHHRAGQLQGRLGRDHRRRRAAEREQGQGAAEQRRAASRSQPLSPVRAHGHRWLPAGGRRQQHVRRRRGGRAHQRRPRGARERHQPQPRDPLTEMTMKMLVAIACAAFAVAASGADYPAPREGSWTPRDFHFHTGEVLPEQRLVSEHLGVKRLRLVIGNSMGGMETWLWAQKYPRAMDIAVPMASLPTEMASRNWMTRRLIVDSIRNDPEWMNGNYTRQPRSA